MGYSLKIGEWTSPDNKGLTPDDDDYDSLGSVANVKFDDAPAYGEPTDHSNSRWPSYTSWSNFTDKAGLQELFGWEQRQTSEVHLIKDHPGVARIKQEHLTKVRQALACYRILHPDAKADPKLSEAENDWDLVRLLWLEYWMNWALKNCKTPVFYNT